MVNSNKKQKINASNAVVDTIVAQATPIGCGGIGIIRVSGSQTTAISKAILGSTPKPRFAQFSNFLDRDNKIIDQGLALYFTVPNSFTGEDVLELQAHGGQVVLDKILRRVVELGARLANPGEFSERAFLNGKIDLTQAEAIADLINSQSDQAASSALRSLQGEFAWLVNNLKDSVIHLRANIEANIDFSDEDIDIYSDKKFILSIDELLKKIITIQQQAQQGILLRDGISVVIAGKPNVGKSSLLNLFCGQESAIVTDIPGTTRDVLREYINFDGLPLHIIDTAGLRDAADIIEQEGVKRAWKEINRADFILLVTDVDNVDITPYKDFINKLIIVRNKSDLIDKKPQLTRISDVDAVYISVKNGLGIDILKTYLKKRVGYRVTTEGVFIARRRHLDALHRVNTSLISCKELFVSKQSLELCAEELRLAQNALGEITGEFYTENLLDSIFSQFCVGK